MEIRPGGHFPPQDPKTEITLEELAALDRCGRNHPSFHELHGEEVSPAVALVEEHLNNGFARLAVYEPGGGGGMAWPGSVPRPHGQRDQGQGGEGETQVDPGPEDQQC